MSYRHYSCGETRGSHYPRPTPRQLDTSGLTEERGDAVRWAYWQIAMSTNLFGTNAGVDALNQAGAEGWEAFATIRSTGSNYVVLLKKAY